MASAKLPRVDPGGSYMIPGVVLNALYERLEKSDNNIRAPQGVSGSQIVVKDYGYGKTIAGRAVGKTQFFVRLEHTGDDLYTAYGIDDIDHEGAEFAVGLAPVGGRPFGTNVDIITHATLGMARVESDSTVTLLEAFGEEYDTKICAEEEPPP